MLSIAHQVIAREAVESMNKPMRPCNHPGCRTLTATGWCQAHKPKPKRGESVAWHGLYSTRMWQELRGQQLLREPFCQNPGCRAIRARGKPERASAVDHIVPHRGDRKLFADQKNLQSLCKPCHDRKTAIERAGKQPSPKGW